MENYFCLKIFVVPKRPGHKNNTQEQRGFPDAAIVYYKDEKKKIDDNACELNTFVFRVCSLDRSKQWNKFPKFYLYLTEFTAFNHLQNKNKTTLSGLLHRLVEH